MIECYSLNGNIYKKPLKFKSFKKVQEDLKVNINNIKDMPVEAIIMLLSEYSKKLSRNKDILKKTGVPFLTFFFRKSNIEKIIQLNLKDKNYLNEFVSVGNGKYIRAQKRGIVCHWIAGNIPTLACYSVFQALITRNSNIVRIPKESITTVLELLEEFKDIEIQYKDEIYSSVNLIENISIVYFESSNDELNNEMSQTADVRILWGGEEAINSLVKLNKKTTCKDIIFGPKYSFAVFEKSAIESSSFSTYIEKLTLDIATFEQNACSSPHVVFIEKGIISLKEFAILLGEAFERLDSRFLNKVDNSTAVKIINKRCEYGLELNKNFYCSKSLKYTILIDKDKKLEEPIGGRCIFLKEVNSIFDVEDLITPRIQTVGIACEDKDVILNFSNKITDKGVDRIMNLGLMNIYDIPWDGVLPLSELVRWCCIQI